MVPKTNLPQEQFLSGINFRLKEISLLNDLDLTGLPTTIFFRSGGSLSSAWPAASARALASYRPRYRLKWWRRQPWRHRRLRVDTLLLRLRRCPNMLIWHSRTRYRSRQGKWWWHGYQRCTTFSSPRFRTGNFLLAPPLLPLALPPPPTPVQRHQAGRWP
jgi:hypothetical protein